MAKVNGDSAETIAEVEETKDEVTEEEKAPMEEDKPTTVRQLKKVTVTIGPLKLADLQSAELHKVLSMNNKFSIDFELKEFPSSEETPDCIAEEKLGYVNIPFEISSSEFLVTLAYKLQSLHIGGRDMSVQLPEEVTTEIEAIKERLHQERQKAAEARRQEQLTKKRFIYMTNLPETVEEETVRSFFPDCLSVMDVTEGPYRYIKLEFKDHEVAQKCLDENKDVEIGEKSVKLSRHPPGEKRESRDRKSSSNPDTRKKFSPRDRRPDRPQPAHRESTWSKPKPKAVVGSMGRSSMMNSSSTSPGNYNTGKNWGASGGKGDYYNPRTYVDDRAGFSKNRVESMDQGRYMSSKPVQSSYSQVRDYGSHQDSGYSRDSYSSGYAGQNKRKSTYDSFDRTPPSKRPYTGGASGYGRGSRNSNYHDNYSSGSYNRFGGGGGGY